ncbi:MAG: adenine phosphoribosyltransferase [Wenzhouxiangellaceae bacterium]|nr:adenine phosphoribosyltransferase [Wenzhouxiangellaceae bacterium]
MDLSELIRDVPDWPEPGIVFKDIAPLLADPAAMRDACARLAEPFAGSGIDRVVGIESRGFLFGVAVAQRLGAGFVPARKPGKLPGALLGLDYSLEYGTDRIEIQADALDSRHRVLVVDDVLATGGTMAATCELVRETGAHLAGAAVLVELGALEGRRRVPADVHALLDL